MKEAAIAGDPQFAHKPAALKARGRLGMPCTPTNRYRASARTAVLRYFSRILHWHMRLAQRRSQLSPKPRSPPMIRIPKPEISKARRENSGLYRFYRGRTTIFVSGRLPAHLWALGIPPSSRPPIPIVAEARPANKHCRLHTNFRYASQTCPCSQNDRSR